MNLQIIIMAKCSFCGEERDTRRIFAGNARGFSDLCFDCVLKFHKIETE